MISHRKISDIGTLSSLPRSLSSGNPRYESEWQREAISHRIQLTLVKLCRLYSTVCRVGSTSWTVKSTCTRGIFRDSKKAGNKRYFHNRYQEEKAHSPVLETSPSPRNRILFFSFSIRKMPSPSFPRLSASSSSFSSSSFSSSSFNQPTRVFLIFSSYFPREESSSSAKISRVLHRVCPALIIWVPTELRFSVSSVSAIQSFRESEMT